jgi:hypothetical protein
VSIVDRPYQESYPPSLWGGVGGPSTGATAGIPGVWTPAGSTPPASQVDAIAGRPYTIKASPATAWTTGQYVQTATAGAGGRVTWTGSAWVGGVAALEADSAAAPEPAGEAEPPPDPPPPERRRNRNGGRKA